MRSIGIRLIPFVQLPFLEDYVFEPYPILKYLINRRDYNRKRRQTKKRAEANKKKERPARHFIGHRPRGEAQTKYRMKEGNRLSLRSLHLALFARMGFVFTTEILCIMNLIIILPIRGVVSRPSAPV
ncbi:hypothetical protein Hanom_Chr04g00363401 [Helianthus anomalus]